MTLKREIHGHLMCYRHGGPDNKGCGCDECRRANREHLYALGLRGKVPPKHGLSGYVNYACRCEICKAANAARSRRRRAANAVVDPEKPEAA